MQKRSYSELNHDLLAEGAVHSPAGIHGFVSACLLCDPVPVEFSETNDASGGGGESAAADPAPAPSDRKTSVVLGLEYAGILLPQALGQAEDDATLAQILAALSADQPAAESGSDALANPDTNGAYAELYSRAQEALFDDTPVAYPLLPEDDVAISSRLTALVDWCLGFLEGFAVEQDASAAVDTSTAEFLKELAEIATLDIDGLEASEGDADDDQAERYLNELIEHIKVSLFDLASLARRSQVSEHGSSGHADTIPGEEPLNKAETDDLSSANDKPPTLQ